MFMYRVTLRVATRVGTIVGDARGDANVEADGTTISKRVSTAAAFSSDNQAGGIAGWTNLGMFECNIAYGAVTALMVVQQVSAQ